MIRYALIGDGGLVVGTGSDTEDAYLLIAENPPPFGHPIALEDGEDVIEGQTALVGLDFVTIPPRPSRYHEWTGEVWRDPRPAADVKEAALAVLRAERDRLLVASDWTDLPNARLTDEQRAAWRAYRAALFDLPETTEDPAAPVWPAKP